jgi:hypothetical protein
MSCAWFGLALKLNAGSVTTMTFSKIMPRNASVGVTESVASRTRRVRFSGLSARFCVQRHTSRKTMNLFSSVETAWTGTVEVSFRSIA